MIKNLKSRVQHFTNQMTSIWRFDFQLPLLSEAEVLEELKSNAG